MTSGIIDVWDATTFDKELASILKTEAEVVQNYMKTDHRIFLAHDLGRAKKGAIRPENPYALAFVALNEAIGEQMETRTIRAWHYTRLTQPEVEALRRDGVHLSTPATLRARMDALVASGVLDAPMADKLYIASPFHSDQRYGRSDKFWMVSHPRNIEDSGVAPLLAHWGGEAASMWTTDPLLLGPLAAIGEPRVLELAVPLALTKHSFSAGKAIIATYGRSLGCIPSQHVFDLYVTAPLGPEAVLRVHSMGDRTYHAIGRSYPDRYVDLDIGRWKELTGQED